MSSNQKNVAVLLGVFLPTVLASYAYLKIAGHTDTHLLQSLRVTARLSFMLYLLVFVARPLRQLFPSTATTWLLRQRRSLGIAFAAMHSAHLALIACRFASFPTLEYPLSSGIVGGLAYALIFLMLITSFDRPARALGPRRWRLLHKTGLYVVGFVFVATLLPKTGEPFLTLERLWFFVLTATAIVLRLTAFFAQRRPQAQP